MACSVSVVIPTFNAGSDLARLLAALKQQTLTPLEVVVVDSGSRDETLKSAAEFGARIISYSERFDHGLARDAGIAAARGEIVVLTVQDAIPAANDWLEKLTRHFSDASVAGVYSRQIPPPDGPLELKIKADLEGAEGSATLVRLAEHADYARYTPAQKLELYRFDDVNSALRRSVWEKLPFGPCTYAEDLQWARKALEAGHTLVRDPHAPVIHAHRRTFSYEFRRGLLDAWMLDELFGYRYSFFKKLNRAGGVVKPGAKGSRVGALKTYSAHALARGIYGFYRCCLKPLGVGRGILVKMSGGI